MASVEDDIVDAVIAGCFINIASVALLIEYANRFSSAPKRKHGILVNKYLVVRPQFGAYNSLMRDLLDLDSAKFRNYIRMDPDVFEELFVKVEPLISRKNTRLRKVK